MALKEKPQFLTKIVGAFLFEDLPFGGVGVNGKPQCLMNIWELCLKISLFRVVLKGSRCWRISLFWGGFEGNPPGSDCMLQVPAMLTHTQIWFQGQLL